MTHYQTRTVVSLSQPEFCQKVDVKEAASLAGGERRAVMLRLLQHFTYDFIYCWKLVSFSVCWNQADVLLDYALRREDESQHFLLKHHRLRQNVVFYVTELTFVYLIPVGLTVILAVWSSPYFQFECNRHTS